MTQQQGSSIAEIYKGVISDVISQVKEAFLDENVDVEVLQQLKKEWEEKLIRSGSVDFEAPKPPQPPQIRQVKAAPHMMTTTSQAISAGSAVRIAQNGQHILVQQSVSSQMPQQAVVMQAANGQPMQRQIQQVHYISTGSIPISTDANVLQQAVQRQQVGQGTSQTIATPIQSGMIFHPGQGARIVNQVGQQYIVQGTAPNLAPGSSVMIVNANGQQIPVTLSSAAMLQTSRIPPSQMNPKVEGVPQLDGAGEVDTQPGSSGTMSIAKRASKFCALKGKKLSQVPQLDGTGRISDSSSDEDDVDEDEDDDPYRRIADQIDDDTNTAEDEEQLVEEDPLNSGDDQSDDEDVERLFEAENVVMCQFEKVHRARSKWKFTLKDGIMHIQGKDYCFQRCSGEAEW